MQNIDGNDSDRSLEHVLRETLKRRAALESTGQCLDADDLAAWADETLSAKERSVIEAHAADCARCAALLATMIRTATPEQVERSWWRLPAMAWVAPMTAAAAGVIIWTVMPDRPSFVSDDQTPRAVIEPSSATTPSVAPPQDAGTRKELSQRGFDQVAKSAEVQEGAAQEGKDKKAATATERDEFRSDRDNASVDASGGAAAAPGPRTPQPESPPAAAPVPQRSAMEEPSTDDARARQTAAATPPPSEPLTPDAAGSAIGGVAGRREQERSDQSAAPSPPRQELADAMAKAQTMAARSQFAPEATIISADASRRWRIVPGTPATSVQRSLDGGATWQSQPIGLTATLAAGSSPSASVCWLAGAAGTILLSTDGRTWQKIPFSESTNLVSIRAASDRSAVVTTADGRSFGTSDGGQIWSRLPDP